MMPHSSPESLAPTPSKDPAPATILHRSSRVISLPSYLRDFHCYNALATLHEPHSYREASFNNLWQAAMTEELDALSRNRTWDLVDLPPDKSVVCCKWVFKIKTRSDESIDQYKARLVAKGFTQEYGIDYKETFAQLLAFHLFAPYWLLQPLVSESYFRWMSKMHSSMGT
jgi:hypothetical protein